MISGILGHFGAKIKGEIGAIRLVKGVQLQ